MLTLVDVPPPKRALIDMVPAADYAAFERRRAARKPLLRACVGFGVVIVLGAFFGDFPRAQAEAGAAACLSLPAVLAAVDAYRGHLLVRRLDQVRADIHGIRKS